MHKHRAKTEAITAYMGSVNYVRQNRAAAGGICVVATCSCGAVRKTNQNQGHIERGPWVEADAL